MNWKVVFVLDADCGRGFTRIENTCVNVSLDAIPKADIETRCTELGTTPLITTSSALYYQLKDYLTNTANSEHVWSDYVGPGVASSEYKNGEAKSSTDLDMDYAWKTAAPYGQDCVRMAADSNYQLEPVGCSGTARFVCVKPACPAGFEWYDKKSCAKVVDTPESKDSALEECKKIHPRAKMLTPK